MGLWTDSERKTSLTRIVITPQINENGVPCGSLHFYVPCGPWNCHWEGKLEEQGHEREKSERNLHFSCWMSKWENALEVDLLWKIVLSTLLGSEIFLGSLTFRISLSSQREMVIAVQWFRSTLGRAFYTAEQTFYCKVVHEGLFLDPSTLKNCGREVI